MVKTNRYAFYKPRSTKDIKYRSARDIINDAKVRMKSLGIAVPSQTKYRHFVLEEARKYQMNPSIVRELANHLGIEWISPPPAIPESWIPSISRTFMSIKYTNPDNEEDYVVLVSSRSIFGVKGVIRHTPMGYVDISWFTDFVPHLDEIACSYTSITKKLSPDLVGKERRALISQHVNDPLNRIYASKGMKPEQLKALHAFFKEYLPGIEGICKNCFQLTLPKSGFGERWFSEKNQECEVRLSSPKEEGHIPQRVLYVTHSYAGREKKVMHVSYEGIIFKPPVKPKVSWKNGPTLPTFQKKHNLPSVHIPWEVYDYHTSVNQLSEKVDLELKLCQCQK